MCVHRTHEKYFLLEMLPAKYKLELTRPRPRGFVHRFQIGFSKPFQKTNFDILKFSLAAMPRGHKQTELNDHVYSFCLFVSSRPHYQAEF